MNTENNFKLTIRKATIEDNMEEIAELIYNTDSYIYPYWFETIDKCKKELSSLLLEENFFFNINNLYVAIDEVNHKIVGILCILDKNVNLEYDYEKLRNYNERYRFIIDNYIKGLIKEVKESEFAYISNVCIHNDYRGKKIGNKLVSHVIEIYAQKCFNGIFLDVLADNPGAIKLYQKLGFNQFTEIFAGFSSPEQPKPDVFSMNIEFTENSKRKR